MLVPRTECWKLALCYQDKLYLCRGRMLKVEFVDQAKLCLFHGQNISSWICGTKPNHVYVADEMLEIGFVVLSQIMFVSRMEC